MTPALRTPTPRPTTGARPPRAPANDLRTVLRQQLPLLLACAALIGVCGFVITAASAYPTV